MKGTGREAVIADYVVRHEKGRELPGNFHELKAVCRIENFERQIIALPEEMPVFRNQRIGARPLDICGDKCIGGLKTFCLIFYAQFKGYDEVFVDDGQAHDETDKFPEFLRGQVAAHFFGNQPGDSQGMRG